jgi:hypothetical protein
MAIFYSNISTDTIGSVLPSDWTQQTGSLTFNVVSDNTTPVTNRILTESAVTTPGDITWNTPGTNNDAEVLNLFQLNSGSAIVAGAFVWANLRHAVGVQTAYSASLIADDTSGGTTGRISSVVNSVVTGSSTTFSFNWSAATWYWCRFRVSGTTLTAKFWLLGNSEPSAVNVTWSDSSLASGLCGVRLGTVGQQLAYFSVGTAGDSPPQPPASGPPSSTHLLSHNTNIVQRVRTLCY